MKSEASIQPRAGPPKSHAELAENAGKAMEPSAVVLNAADFEKGSAQRLVLARHRGIVRPSISCRSRGAQKLI